jgi:hypothetical protein
MKNNREIHTLYGVPVNTCCKPLASCTTDLVKSSTNGWTVKSENDMACGKPTQSALLIIQCGWHVSKMWSSLAYMDISWKTEQGEMVIQCPENCWVQTCNLKLRRFLILENMLSVITSTEEEEVSSGTQLSTDPYHGILSLTWNFLCWSPLVQTNNWKGSKIRHTWMTVKYKQDKFCKHSHIRMEHQHLTRLVE